MKVLQLEDDPLDRELTGTLCQHRLPGCEVHAVANRDDYLRALSDGGYAAIISDSCVPHLSGVEALQFAQQRAPGVPFIFFCGAIGSFQRKILLALQPSAVISKEEPEALLDELAKCLRPPAAN